MEEIENGMTIDHENTRALELRAALKEAHEKSEAFAAMLETIEAFKVGLDKYDLATKAASIFQEYLNEQIILSETEVDILSADLFKAERRL